MSFMESTQKQQTGNPNTTNAVGHTSMVQNLVRQADKDLQQYHNLINQFRQQLQSTHTKILNNIQQIMDTTRPLVQSLYRTLELGMVNQKEENTNFQEQVTELKKEKSVLSQMIVATSRRCQGLAREVGFY